MKNNIFNSENTTVISALSYARYDVTKITLESRLAKLRKDRQSLLEKSPKNVSLLLEVNKDEQNEVKNAISEVDSKMTEELEDSYYEVVSVCTMAGNSSDNVIRLLRLVACAGDRDAKKYFNYTLSAFSADELLSLYNQLVRITDDNVTVINERIYYDVISSFVRRNFSMPFETIYNGKFRAKLNASCMKRIIHTFIRGYKNVFSDDFKLLRVDINTSIRPITKGKNKGQVKAEPFMREVAGVVEYLAFK